MVLYPLDFKTSAIVGRSGFNVYPNPNNECVCGRAEVNIVPNDGAVCEDCAKALLNKTPSLASSSIAGEVCLLYP